MRARVLTVALLGLLGGCIDREFLRGTPCINDRDCDRSLSCEQRVCGGCPAGVPLVGGRCACPGDRVLDCRVLDGPPHCMPVCEFAREQCEVVELGNDDSIEVVPACGDTSGEPCFEVQFDDTPCPGDQALISVQPEGSAPKLVVNCPPPESEESHFDCEPP